MAGELRTACRATRDAGASAAFGQREDGFESQVPSRSAEAKRAGWPPVGMKSTRLAAAMRPQRAWAIRPARIPAWVSALPEAQTPASNPTPTTGTWWRRACVISSPGKRRGFAYSATNGLILDFKKPVARCGEREWRYKEAVHRRCGGGAVGALPEVECRITPTANPTYLKPPIHT